MIRGFMKTTSRSALLAAAGILMGSYAYGPAKAADLGGSCCGDLEERVAELEATTARKGNRVVSLQIYGQVNKALLYWDDGVESDTYVVDNTVGRGRAGFTGKATLKPGWTAGYTQEWAFADARSDLITRPKTGDDPADDFSIRHNYLWIESERLGRVSLGQQSSTADGASGVAIANALRGAQPEHGTSIVIRTTAGGDATAGTNVLTLGELATDLGGGRNDLIRYDSPTFYGFIVSASWGDNDYADVALRYQKEWNSVRIAAAIAYMWDNQYTRTDNIDFEALIGSFTAMHVPTGLFVALSAGQRDYEHLTGDDSTFWYIQGGVERRWLPYGATTLYAEYGSYDSFALDEELATTPTATIDSEATRWGFGVVQKFDKAALDLYAQATFWSFDVPGVATEDLQTVIVGSRIKF